ncbi:9546_t:CDS:2 [Gigaspora margarita]|uniref:9546_t:CDS:1 n=1 Tax=Gigaspora margarita TaxID=4874 RepID=A0ABN7VST3_GIGMA|nr:9546_t:CDS:2 [Gigaspora margarita]
MLKDAKMRKNLQQTKALQLIENPNDIFDCVIETFEIRKTDINEELKKIKFTVKLKEINALLDEKDLVITILHQEKEFLLEEKEVHPNT